MRAFGGLEPAAIHALVGSGYGTWVDTDPADSKVVSAHGATVVDAPVDRVYAAVTDFARTHEHISLLGPTAVREIDEHRFEARFQARVGLAFLKLAVPLAFRFRADSPGALHMEEYLGGAFERCVLELRFDVLSPERTLFVMSFHGDVRSLGAITRFFIQRAPELELAIEGNMVVVAMMAMAGLAGRSERPPDGGPEGPPLQERLTELGPALDHGILTVGRVDARGQVADVCSAARIAASPEQIWPVVSDPARLAEVLSFVEKGRRRSRSGGSELELTWKARFGPLRKRYRLAVSADEEPGRRLSATRATVDGEPATFGDVLVPDGASTLYAHHFATDLKRDWLTRRFLGKHPELERLIAQYPPMMQVIALRRHFGAPPR